MVIIQRNEHICRIHTVYPLRNIFHGIIRHFPGDCITKHHPANRHTAKQSDIIFFHRTNPIRCTALINFKADVIKHIGRIRKPQMSVNVSAKMVAHRITDFLLQTHALRFLCRHVNTDIRRNSVPVVRKPFNQAAILKRCHTHRLILIINLCIHIADFKLGNHIHHCSHDTVADGRCRIFIQHRNLVVGNLMNIISKASGFHI